MATLKPEWTPVLTVDTTCALRLGSTGTAWINGDDGEVYLNPASTDTDWASATFVFPAPPRQRHTGTSATQAD